jgi:predicted metal-dependent HD superfamily phosphohydrolase
MAKKNIYIHDSIYDKMSAEAEKRGISFSHACSLAFSAWLSALKQVKVSLDKHNEPKKDPSEGR